MRGLRFWSGGVLVALAGAALAVASAPANAASPPPLRTIPPRPLPPLGAVPTMSIPPLDQNGVRQTVNADLTPARKVSNLRSALNVAALNCLEARYQPVVAAYKMILKRHAAGLAAANRALDGEFRRAHGARFEVHRDRYLTKVYNYFALPPVLPDLCEAALGVANDSLLVAPGDLGAFAEQALPRLDQPFEAFFRAFERYRADAAAWDARYGAPFAHATPMRAIAPR